MKPREARWARASGCKSEDRWFESNRWDVFSVPVSTKIKFVTDKKDIEMKKQRRLVGWLFWV